MVTVISFVSSFAHGVTPVYNEFTVDTSLYTVSHPLIYCIPGPNLASIREPISSIWMFIYPCLRKNSDQVDLFSAGGKCGTVTIPTIQNRVDNHSNTYYYCSQTFIDEDIEWETLYILEEADSLGGFMYHFEVFDNDGTSLLSDTGRASYGFDGQNTYVLTGYVSDYKPLSIRSWRFRTNVTASAPSLRKTTAATMPMTIYGPTSDNLRIKLLPTGSNRTTVQLFDLMGRCIFSKEVGKLTSPVTFTVPEKNVPQSPFITRVENNDGSYVKKRLPVR